MARISSVIGFLFISLSLSCEENKGNEFETWEISFDAPDDAVETEDNYEFGDFSDACLIPWCPDAQEIEETEAADGWEAQIDTEDEHYDVSDGQELQEISSIKCGVIDAEFPEFDKSCEKDEDCVLVYHQINCCGTLVAWGLNAFEKTAFEYAESVCQSQYPPCGCAQAPTMAEDLNTAFSEEDFSVKCKQEKCRSYVKGKVPKCRDSNDCDNFQMCLAPGEKLPCGICFQPEETCVSDAGCGDAKVCEWIASGCLCYPAMQCVPACDEDGAPPCGDLQYCGMDGHCYDKICLEDDDCPEFFHCPAMDVPHCERDACQTDSDCVWGFCVEGHCYGEPGTCSHIPA